MRHNPEAPRCSWCDLRCRDRSELSAHEAEHRREESERVQSDGQTSLAAPLATQAAA